MHPTRSRRSFSLFAIIVMALLAPALASITSAQSEPVAKEQLYLPLVSSNRAVAVNGALQPALDAARPGDVILLGATTYAQDITIKRSGTAGAPITIRGAGVGRTIIRGSLRVQGAAFVRLQDLEINAAGESDAIRIEAPAHHIDVQRVQLYGGKGYGVRIGNDVTDVLVEDSHIHHFDAGSSDAHGIGIMTASNITIRRCDIHHNSGDAVQSNTPDYPGYKRWASNILVEDSALHDNRENAIDVKSTHGMVIRNNRMWGFRAVSSSDGMALQVQYDAQDITIVGNQIWDAVEGIEITRGRKSGTDYPAFPQRVTIVGNLLHGMVDDPGGDSGSGSGIVVRTSAGVKVYNNTVVGAAGAALYLSYSSEDAIPTGVDVRNNVLDGKSDDLYLAADPKKFAGLVIDYNHYVNGRVDGETIARWLAQGYERHPTSGNPLLNDQQLPLPLSPLLDSGTDVGMRFNGAKPDRGWGDVAP